MKNKEKIVIIGGGASALAFSILIDTEKYDVSIYEQKSTIGRKFLVAGNGGFNLTHGSPIATMLEKYEPVSWMSRYVQSFDNEFFRSTLLKLSIKTYTGSSNRVFPEKGIKPNQVLSTIKTFILQKGIRIYTGYSLQTLEGNILQFRVKEEMVEVNADHYVFSLGGGSWAKTGSDGKWLELFANRGVQTIPFEASNCGWEVDWPQKVLSRLEGKPLKNIACAAGNQYCKGEILFTSYGIEGSALYSVQVDLRNQLVDKGSALLHLDLKPQWTEDEVKEKLSKRGDENRTTFLKEKIKLSKEAVFLLKSCLSKEEFLSDLTLCSLIKRFPVNLLKVRPIDEAISTIGGVNRSALDENLQLNKLPNHYCIGEMIDWDAPTGGYLLQACFSMGFYLANYLNKK